MTRRFEKRLERAIRGTQTPVALSKRILQSDGSNPAILTALEERLNATAQRAFDLAARHRRGTHVRPDDDLSDSAQNTLRGAAIGSLGCTPGTAERCREALDAWEDAIMRRAAKEHAEGAPTIANKD